MSTLLVAAITYRRWRQREREKEGGREREREKERGRERERERDDMLLMKQCTTTNLNVTM